MNLHGDYDRDQQPDQRYKNHDNARRVEFPLLTSVHHKRNLLQVIVGIVIYSYNRCCHHGHWSFSSYDNISKGKSAWRYGEQCPKEREHCRHSGDDDDESSDAASYLYFSENILTNLLFQFYEDGVWELSKVQFFSTSITSIFSQSLS